MTNVMCVCCLFMLVIWCELNQTIKSCYFWPTPATKSGVTKIFGQRKCALTPMEPCKLWIRVHKITTMQNQKPTRKLFWIPNLINKGANWNAIAHDRSKEFHWKFNPPVAVRMIQLHNPLLRFHKTTKGNFSEEDFFNF